MFNTSLEQCPYSDWERSARFSCISSERFHCLKDEYERIGWLCIDPIWIESGRCPVYNAGAKKLDSYTCNGVNCPMKNYRSNEVYIKKACQLHYSSSEKKNETNVPSSPGTDGGKASHVGVYIAVGVIVPLLLVLLAGVVFLIVRRKQSFHQKSTLKDEDDEKSVIHPLVDTSADKLPTALDCLNSNHFVVLKGIPGSGKTYLAHTLVDRIDGKNKHQTKWIHDAPELEHFSFKRKYMILVLDDVFYELQSEEEVNIAISKVEELFLQVGAAKAKGLYVIVTVPSYVWKKHFKEFNTKTFSYLAVDLDTLNKMEREFILKDHMEKNSIQDGENGSVEKLNMRNRVKLSIINTERYDFIGYPSCIAWICKAQIQSDLNEADRFLLSPVTKIKNEIMRLCNSDNSEERKMFLTLAFIAFSDGSSNVKNIDKERLKDLGVILLSKEDDSDYDLDKSLFALEKKYLRKKAVENYEFQIDVVRKLVFVIAISKNKESLKQLKQYISENVWKRFVMQRDKFPDDLVDEQSSFFLKI